MKYIPIQCIDIFIEWTCLIVPMVKGQRRFSFIARIDGYSNLDKCYALPSWDKHESVENREEIILWSVAVAVIQAGERSSSMFVVWRDWHGKWQMEQGQSKMKVNSFSSALDNEVYCGKIVLTLRKNVASCRHLYFDIDRVLRLRSSNWWQCKGIVSEKISTEDPV